MTLNKYSSNVGPMWAYLKAKLRIK